MPHDSAKRTSILSQMGLHFLIAVLGVIGWGLVSAVISCLIVGIESNPFKCWTHEGRLAFASYFGSHFFDAWLGLGILTPLTFGLIWGVLVAGVRLSNFIETHRQNTRWYIRSLVFVASIIAAILGIISTWISVTLGP